MQDLIFLFIVVWCAVYHVMLRGNAKQAVFQSDEEYSRFEDILAQGVDMRFNLGPNRFRYFKKMIAAVKNQDFVQAAAEMKDSRWYNQVGQRARTLVKMMSSA
ncbi:MAG: hypothetical protein U9P10_00310 [Thermodesulfobacteriota bacterium]|nr:hypothetical protein [Thermodesulfobacteriota bacterium]